MSTPQFLLKLIDAHVALSFGFSGRHKIPCVSVRYTSDSNSILEVGLMSTRHS